MNMMLGNPRPRSGFTLMEVLVAIFISSMIMTAVLQTLTATQKAVDAIHNITLHERAGPQLVAMFRKDLDRLAVYDAGQYTLLKGDDEMLRGVDADRIDMLVYGRSVIPHYDAVADARMHAPVNEVGYWVRERAGTVDFLELFRREDFLVDDEPWAGGNFSLLNDRIISFGLQYYERPEFDPPSEDNWDSAQQAQLPYCIELTLELEIQPRKSAESREILGANLARLEFHDLIVIPESQRFLFRNRLHPMVPGLDAGGGADGGGAPSENELDDVAESGGVGRAGGGGGSNVIGGGR